MKGAEKKGEGAYTIKAVSRENNGIGDIRGDLGMCSCWSGDVSATSLGGRKGHGSI